MFLDFYKNDLQELLSFLRRNFKVDFHYYDYLIHDFPLSLEGYIEFSLKVNLKEPHVRFFLVFYEREAQEWIRNNLEKKLKTLEPDFLNSFKYFKELFEQNCWCTYGADLSQRFFKLYFVGEDISRNIKSVLDFFGFQYSVSIRDFPINMIGLNLQEKPILKLYAIFHGTNFEILKKNFPIIKSLPSWALKELSRLEIFFTILPEKGFEVSSVAMPTLFNFFFKELFLDKFRGLFSFENIYPSWLSFDQDGEIENIYFRPKRDYRLLKDNQEIRFQDADFRDYADVKNY